MAEPWRWLADLTAAPGAVQMARDAQLAALGQPTARVYRWSRPTVSLGFHQPSDEIDLSACASLGFDAVRRPTGGRAVLHAEEVTYAVVLPAAGISIAALHSRIGAALALGLRTVFGIDATVAPRPELSGRRSAAPCFGSSARDEVQVGGRKLVGSAQRRMGSGQTAVALQHGSILLGPAHRRLAEVLRGPVDSRAFDHATELETVLGAPVDPADVARAVRLGLSQTFGIDLTDREWTDDERLAAEHAAADYALFHPLLTTE